MLSSRLAGIITITGSHLGSWRAQTHIHGTQHTQKDIPSTLPHVRPSQGEPDGQRDLIWQEAIRCVCCMSVIQREEEKGRTVVVVVV